MKVVAAVLGILVLFMAMGWLVQGNDFFMYKFWAPKYEDVKRDVFENTKSYREGKVQELRNYQMQYVQATPEHKAALRKIILHQIADFPEENLPTDLRVFLSQLRSEIGG